MPSSRHLLILAAVLAPLLAGLLPPAAAEAATCARADVPSAQQSKRSVARTTLCLVNAQRSARGLRTLRPDARLARAGAAHASDMVRRRYFSHDSLDGRTPIERIVDAGYGRGRGDTVTGGENLGWAAHTDDSPRAIVDAWMDSPPHRRVILFRAFRRGGVATAAGTPVTGEPGTTYSLLAGN